MILYTHHQKYAILVRTIRVYGGILRPVNWNVRKGFICEIKLLSNTNLHMWISISKQSYLINATSVTNFQFGSSSRILAFSITKKSSTKSLELNDVFRRKTLTYRQGNMGDKANSIEKHIICNNERLIFRKCTQKLDYRKFINIAVTYFLNTFYRTKLTDFNERDNLFNCPEIANKLNVISIISFSVATYIQNPKHKMYALEYVDRAYEIFY